MAEAGSNVRWISTATIVMRKKRTGQWHICVQDMEALALATLLGQLFLKRREMDSIWRDMTGLSGKISCLAGDLDWMREDVA
ncbi:MAG: hypothetical protein CMJ72_15895 [Planctomycetaceae bacterium]|nr:hypothetical protein [Planctomycetaceae bacterium]